jgi:hypothetical protein
MGYVCYFGHIELPKNNADWSKQAVPWIGRKDDACQVAKWAESDLSRREDNMKCAAFVMGFLAALVSRGRVQCSMRKLRLVPQPIDPGILRRIGAL